MINNRFLVLGVLIIYLLSCTNLSKQEAQYFVQDVMDNPDSLDEIFERHKQLTAEYRDSILGNTSPQKWFGNLFKIKNERIRILTKKTYFLQNDNAYYFTIHIVIGEDIERFENINFNFKKLNKSWILRKIEFNK